MQWLPRPALAALGELAGTWIAARLWRTWRSAVALAAAMLLGGLFLPVREMIWLHPYQYTHFNALAGGIRAADDRYMLDYWGLSTSVMNRWGDRVGFVESR